MDVVTSNVKRKDIQDVYLFFVGRGLFCHCLVKVFIFSWFWWLNRKKPARSQQNSTFLLPRDEREN